jgi:cell division protein FtsQ
MQVKITIKKLLILGASVAAVAGLSVLLVAAIKERNHKTCKGYEIEIKGSSEKWFLDKKAIADLLTGNNVITGKILKRIELSQIEARLENNPWIKNAELFFGNNQVLQVRIEEREPVARIFTVTGNSFYIDSSGHYLPLSDKFSARLPVFTGFPSDKLTLNSADRILLGHIKKVSAFLSQSPFWMAQIAQTDITPERTFEMVPVIGQHIIVFGDGTDCDKKFTRLMVFYQQVLSKAGMDMYKRVNIQYAKQVIGEKRVKGE